MNDYSENPPLFDKDAMLENIGGDEEMLKILLNLFMKTADGVLLELRRPEVEMAGEAYTLLWQRQMHLLRGSALNIGAEEFCHYLAQAEHDAPDLSATQKAARLELLDSLYGDLRRYIEKIIS